MLGFAESTGRQGFYGSDSCRLEVYEPSHDRYGVRADVKGQRQRHFAKIGAALSDWARRKRAAGIDLALLRDTQAYEFETENGHYPETLSEWNFDGGRAPRVPTDEEPAALDIGGWMAVSIRAWCCEGYRVRDEAGRMRGHVQVRYGVVRAVVADERDAAKV